MGSLYESFNTTDMKFSAISSLMVLVVVMAATVSGKPKTYLIDTADNHDNLEQNCVDIGGNIVKPGEEYAFLADDGCNTCFGMCGLEGAGCTKKACGLFS